MWNIIYVRLSQFPELIAVTGDREHWRQCHKTTPIKSKQSNNQITINILSTSPLSHKAASYIRNHNKQACRTENTNRWIEIVDVGMLAYSSRIPHRGRESPPRVPPISIPPRDCNNINCRFAKSKCRLFVQSIEHEAISLKAIGWIKSSLSPTRLAAKGGCGGAKAQNNWTTHGFNTRLNLVITNTEWFANTEYCRFDFRLYADSRYNITNYFHSIKKMLNIAESLDMQKNFHLIKNIL